MSKLSQLKQDAYQAGKKRDWVRAVSIYEQILEMDKNNPTLINELGDLCLKTGNTARGVKHFLGAASKYRQSGLLNNAVAIYKKILRYDEENQNAHWYLTESRASQGLLMEGEHHALIFLGSMESVSGDIKEIFLKRCGKLFELYQESLPIQENLLQVFRMWSMPQEALRAQIQVACLKFKDGERQQAESLVKDAIGQMPELTNYPEYARWQELIGVGATAPGVNDFDSVAFSQSPTQPQAPSPEAPPAERPSGLPAAPEVDFGEVNFGEIETKPTPSGPTLEEQNPPPVVESRPEKIPQIDSELPEDTPDDGGCFNLDLDSNSSFDDLIAQATAGLPEVATGTEQFSDLMDGLDDETVTISDAKTSVAGEPGASLLDQLLSDDGDSGWQAPEGEVETISEEIGSQMGGDAASDDPASLYEMGMVYLEMGLHDQACSSFQKASCHQDYAITALEMWGITLLRMNNTEQAIAVLTDGLDVPEEGSREYLGLLYHIARANEQAENFDEAQRLFRMIHQQDSHFLDVSKRLVKHGTLN